MRSQRTLRPLSVHYRRPNHDNPSEPRDSRMSSWGPVNLYRILSSFPRVYRGSSMSKRPLISHYGGDDERWVNKPCPTDQTMTVRHKQGLRGGKGRTRIRNLMWESSRSSRRQVMQAIPAYIPRQPVWRWLAPVELGSLTIYCGDGGD